MNSLVTLSVKECCPSMMLGEALINTPKLTTVTMLRKAIGAFSYVQRWIPGMADIAKPLYDLWTKMVRNYLNGHLREQQHLNALRLQDTLLFCGKSLLRAQYQSDFHQIFTKCSPVHAKYGKVVKLTNNKII